MKYIYNIIYDNICHSEFKQIEPFPLYDFLSDQHKEEFELKPNSREVSGSPYV